MYLHTTNIWWAFKDSHGLSRSWMTHSIEPDQLIPSFLYKLPYNCAKMSNRGGDFWMTKSSLKEWKTQPSMRFIATSTSKILNQLLATLGIIFTLEQWIVPLLVFPGLRCRCSGGRIYYGHYRKVICNSFERSFSKEQFKVCVCNTVQNIAQCWFVKRLQFSPWNKRFPK